MPVNYSHFVAAAAAAVLLAGAATPALAQGASGLNEDAPRICGPCDRWNEPFEPFRIFGNTYYVGTAGLSAVLIASDDGLILLDGGLPQSAALIDRNIRALGFRTEDVRLIVNSHAHYDHAGGIAALQRASGAMVAASPAGAIALRRGEPTPDDPQFAFGHDANSFPPVDGVTRAADGVALHVGELAVTPVFTPGHTPGSTTWTWGSCEDDRCLTMVYADSLNAVSADEFRYSDDAERLAAFERAIATVAGLSCDVLISVHPEFVGLEGKRDALLERTADDRENGKNRENPFVDPEGCRAYAASASAALKRRIAAERP